MNNMKKIILILTLFISCLLSTSSFAGGALCLYVNGDGVVVCTIYNNSGVGSESSCSAEARASNPACGINMGAINTAAGSCASNIFISPNRCLDNVAPHNITGSATQATCEAAGDRWCPSSYYGFFVGNSACQTAICDAANVSLPIELIDFKGYIEGSDNIITWNTASEHNSAYFILEHSTDGKNWNQIALIPSSGNSTEIKGYKAIHISPDISVNYYRLFQIDFDGTATSYNPISIDNRTEFKSVLKVTNLLGQEIDINTKGFILITYTNGETEKKYN